MGSRKCFGRDGPGLKGQSRTTLGEDFRLINNRQGGRRRGRGGGRPQGGNPNPGNRQDNRQRGNAAQLLEKYKGLARDSQMQGDRIQTEYYLQYADHYFRVLNENRARFEETRRPRDDYEASEEEEDRDESQDGDEGGQDSDEQDYGRRDYREPREVREPREAREAREPRETREPREAREAREPREVRDDRNGERRPRRRRPEAETPDEERIAVDSLPPAISAVPDVEVERAPRRRPRRPRDAEDIAPAA